MTPRKDSVIASSIVSKSRIPPQDDIGIFTQRRAQSGGEGLGVQIEFALIHEA